MTEVLSAVGVAGLALWVIAPLLRHSAGAVLPGEASGSRAPVASRGGRRCTTCGPRPESGARYCSNCGEPIAD